MCRYALQMLTFSVESSQVVFLYSDCYKDSYLYALFIVTFSALKNKKNICISYSRVSHTVQKRKKERKKVLYLEEEKSLLPESCKGCFFVFLFVLLLLISTKRTSYFTKI